MWRRASSQEMGYGPRLVKVRAPLSLADPRASANSRGLRNLTKSLAAPPEMHRSRGSASITSRRTLSSAHVLGEEPASRSTPIWPTILAAARRGRRARRGPSGGGGDRHFTPRQSGGGGTRSWGPRATGPQPFSRQNRAFSMAYGTISIRQHPPRREFRELTSVAGALPWTESLNVNVF